MKVNDIRNMSAAEMEQKVSGLKEELFNLRFQLATGQLENPMRILKLRRQSLVLKLYNVKLNLNLKTHNNRFVKG